MRIHLTCVGCSNDDNFICLGGQHEVGLITYCPRIGQTTHFPPLSAIAPHALAAVVTPPTPPVGAIGCSNSDVQKEHGASPWSGSGRQ
jgi:hypothetical protein